MTKPYIELDHMAIDATLYGIFRLIPRKSDMCAHVTCGHNPATTKWDYNKGKQVTTKAGKLVKCSYERYTKCTTQELSVPDAKIGTIFAAIMVSITFKGFYGWECKSMIFLYDLIGDTIKDKWLQNGGNDSVAPHSQSDTYVSMPSQLLNIKDVVEGMKKVL